MSKNPKIKTVNRSAGKGSNRRPCNQKKYYAGYDSIKWNKKKTKIK